MLGYTVLMTIHQPRNISIGRCLAADSVAIAILAFFMTLPSAAFALERVEDFGENPGELQMYLHRPAAASDDMPLVVALHGCKQTAADFDDETGLKALAEEIPFLLLLRRFSADGSGG